MNGVTIKVNIRYIYIKIHGSDRPSSHGALSQKRLLGPAPHETAQPLRGSDLLFL